MDFDRRGLIVALSGALLGGAPADLLSHLPGPPLLSAGVIARRGGRVFRASEGHALRAAGERRFGFDAPFRVASVSKMISAAGLMRLVEEGRVDLDADASRYLGAAFRHPAFPEQVISLRMLLSHTSGLRNGDDFPVPFGRPLLPRLIAAGSEPNHGGWFSPEPPGVFHYSDTNFAMVAQIIERVSGRRFDLYMRETLFAPMELDIGYNWSGVRQAKRDRAAAGCRIENGAWTPQVDAAPPGAPAIAFYRTEQTQDAREQDYRVGDNGFAFAPHGGLRLALADMDRLARMFAAGGLWRRRRIVAPDLLNQMTSAVWTSSPGGGQTENGLYQAYGLGVQTPLGASLSPGEQGDDFFAAGRMAGSAWRGHCGDAYGWMTGLWWNARDGATLVYALNGMPETDRPRGVRSAMTAPEEALIDSARAGLD